MKIFIAVLKVIMLILTAIWGMFFGIIAPIAIMINGYDFVPQEIAEHPIIKLWLISSILFYVGGAFVTMLGHTKIASVLSVLGLICTFIIYATMENMFINSEGSSPTIMYMPCIFITIVILIIMLLTNIPLWLEKKNKQDNEKAPSILG